ncbi:spike base protein, RCAP_Rcc01079 family [Methylobacterium pseudosasicola]|uniref:Uncharacterized protein n=1 Tax=Methylobacterium pseudosasicola TaxID=582667 RepID=A0A1I4U132_9HYPH|nr:hypothetical protein [Methylobacterium pseudosasicola]SFM82714.1 hypothetical protein SAMN05192568_106132 [Methylobacterium pseudosasicola]
MATDLSFSGSGPARSYTPDARKADGTRSAFTDRTIVELAPEGNHATAAQIAALQSTLVSALGLLATDQDVMTGNAKLEAIRLLLATPTIPGGAATDVSVQAITTKLEAVRALLAAPALASGAAADASVQAVTAKLEAIRVLQASPALPTGGATEATLQAIKSAILAQVDLANLIVTDGSGYYVRRETVNEGTGAVTVSFVTLAGAPASPNTAALTPVTASGSGGAASTRVVETALFDVATAGTGTSVGDVVARVLVYDTAANSVVASYWHNLTTGAALSTAPAAGAIVAQLRNLAVGAAKDATLVTIDADLNAGLGTDGTSPPSLPGGATGVRGWLRYLASLFPASLGQKTAALSFPVVISSDGPIATAYGTLTDTATPDITANGASFTFTSLFKGMVANLLAISGKLPASLGPKAKASALAVTTATDDPALAAIAATGPGTDAFAVTTSDSTNFTTNARSIYVGGAGDVTIVTPANTVVTFKAVPVGSILPVQAKRVNATATTASNLVGLI